MTIWSVMTGRSASIHVNRQSEHNMNIAMPQPGGRPFRPTGSDPLSVEWRTPMSCRSAEEAYLDEDVQCPERRIWRRLAAAGTRLEPRKVDPAHPYRLFGRPPTSVADRGGRTWPCARRLYFSRKLRSARARDGCFSFRSALASICRMRSRVTENTWPTCSRVWSLFVPMPKRIRRMRSSRGVMLPQNTAHGIA